jgi:polysaccharide biosynthesis protein PslF
VSSRPRIIWLAPDSGGVSDYSGQLIAAIRRLDVELWPIYLRGPEQSDNGDFVRNVRHARAQIRGLRKGAPAVVHAEISAGGIEVFWSAPAQDRLVTATVHDGPHFAWWPAYSRGVAKNRLLHHALHFPFRRGWWRLEDGRFSQSTLFVLTQAGQDDLEGRGFDTVRLVHHVPAPVSGTFATERPLNVGLYGYYYGGKGFDLIPDLRERLPEDIGLHIAGRGTDDLRVPPGATRWGEVNGEREAAFFGSIRCLLLPYEPGGRYGPFLSASGAAARAFSYGLPVVASPVRGFVEEAGLSPAVQLARSNSAGDLADAVTSLVLDRQLTDRATQAAEKLRQARTVEASAELMVSTWERLLSQHQSQGL